MRQAAHCAPASGAPQLEQNLPVAGAWHAGHCVEVEGADVGLVMGELYRLTSPAVAYCECLPPGSEMSRTVR